jgi:hypothetical protein
LWRHLTRKYIHEIFLNVFKIFFIFFISFLKKKEKKIFFF